MGARGQRSQVKGQGASLSSDEISRLMDMPAVTELLVKVLYKCKTCLGGKEKRERGRRVGHIQNEWRVFRRKIRDVFALLNDVEGENGCEEFSEVKTEVCSLFSPRDKEKQSRAKKKKKIIVKDRECEDRGESWRGKSGGKGRRYVSTYCRWQVAWSLEPACLSEGGCRCVCVCVCVVNSE